MAQPASGSVFSQVDGAFLVYGKENNAKITSLIAAGDTFVPGVNGSGPDFLKLEIGGVVPDTSRRQALAANKNKKNQRRLDADTAFQALDAALNDTSTSWAQAAVIEENFDRVRVLMRYLLAQDNGGTA